jgi:Immunity protein 42
MIVGNPSTFAIESQIEKAFERVGSRALGFFNILIADYRYGVHGPDATLLAVSFDEVQRRISRRGRHITPFTEADPGVIADAFRAAIYGKEYGSPFPQMALEDFADIVHSSRIEWAPDGDEAFDDSSYVLQFDTGNRVRLIGFRTKPDGRYDHSTLKDLWLESEEFYGVLHRWHSDFLAEWESLPKVRD